jgi:hypothetical protein
MATTNISVNDLSWGQRFAIINAYTPTDDQACKALGVTEQELSTAKSLITKGVFQVDTTLNVEPYGVLFGRVSNTKPKINVSSPNPDAKKRGRKGDKIQGAFASITETPVPAEQFVKDHGISMPVLRQFKRFDKTELPGQVFVRKQSGVLMVWRGPVVDTTEPTT